MNLRRARIERLHPERGSAMLASLCLATVAAISLGSYVTITYHSLQASDQIVAAEEQLLDTENMLEETLHSISSVSFEDWTIDGDQATRTVTGIDLALVAKSLPVDFTESLKLDLPLKPELPTSPFSKLEQLFGRFSRFGSPGFVATPEPAPQEVIDPTAIVMKLTGLSNDRSTRQLTLTQRQRLADGSIQVRELTANIEPLTPVHHALVAQKTVRLRREGVIDSYKSSLGTYSAKTAGYDAVIAGKSINVSRAEVHGYAAASGNAEPTFGSKASLLGPTTSAKVKVDPTRIVATPFQPRLQTVVPTGAGTLVTSAMTTLGTAGGTVARIYYADTLDLRNDRELTIVGPVRLVVSGNLSLSDRARIVVQAAARLELHVGGNTTIGGRGIVNESLKPANVALLVEEDATRDVTFASAAPLYGVVYAPNADFQTLGADREIYGAILARSITFDDRTSLHFDTDVRAAYFDGIETAYVFDAAK